MELSQGLILQENDKLVLKLIFTFFLKQKNNMKYLEKTS